MLAGSGRRRLDKKTMGSTVIGVLGVLDIVGFGLQARPGDAHFGLTLPGASADTAVR